VGRPTAIALAETVSPSFAARKYATASAPILPASGQDRAEVAREPMASLPATPVCAAPWKVDGALFTSPFCFDALCRQASGRRLIYTKRGVVP
jgi:hypothetical protein